MNPELHSPSPLTPDHFLAWAQVDNWVAFDAAVLHICNEPYWLNWVHVGIHNTQDAMRDLAICILEKMTKGLSEGEVLRLLVVMQQDANFHLRRKAAIALWVKGFHQNSIRDVLMEAYVNDPELQEQIKFLLKIE